MSGHGFRLIARNIIIVKIISLLANRKFAKIAIHSNAGIGLSQIAGLPALRSPPRYRSAIKAGIRTRIQADTERERFPRAG